MNSCNIDTKGMVPTEEIRGDSQRDTELLGDMAASAASFLREQPWCRRIVRQLLAFGIGGVIAIFFCEIVPAAKNVDRCLWVVTGDLPPAYLVIEGNPTAREALDAYIEEMREWVMAVREGRSVEDLIPVNGAPTLGNAVQLETRLNFLEKEIRPMIPIPSR